MKAPWLPAAILTLLVAAPPALGVDLTKIDRTIAKEPVYQTKTPKYCLLVFGQEAKLRAWLVLDGNVMYVDRNGDGDLTGASERVEPKVLPGGCVCEIGPLSLAGSKIQYVVSWVGIHDNGRVHIVVTRKGDSADRRTAWHILEYLQFAARPQDAPIVHVDGPLTLKPKDTKQVFVRGDTPSPFEVMVGTPGLGKGTFTKFLLVGGDPDGIAEIVFPHRDPAGKSIVVKVALKLPDN
jgi:hypothetical protein